MSHAEELKDAYKFEDTLNRLRELIGNEKLDKFLNNKVFLNNMFNDKSISYRKKVKQSDFQTCADKISPMILSRDFVNAFSVFDEMKIGPNTVNPKQRNFLWWLIELIRREIMRKNPEGANYYLDFFKLFINHVGNIDHQDRYKITALNWAVYYHQVDVCQVLLEKGATPDIPDNFGMTPFDYAITLYYEEKYGYFSSDTSSEIIMGDIMKLLLQYGANIKRSYPRPDELRKGYERWLFMHRDDSIPPYKSPLDLLQREAPLYGYASHINEEPRIKIALEFEDNKTYELFNHNKE